MYDVAEHFQDQKMKADILYDAFMNKDTTNLDKMCSDILALVNERYPKMSNTFKEVTQQTMTDNARISKHALLLFGLWLTPDYAKTLVHPEPKLDPNKFQQFYSTILSQACQNHLNGHFTSLQEFVEYIIPAYIQM